MPNHITSQVRIGGDKEKIAKLIKESKLIQDGDVESTLMRLLKCHQNY